MEEERRVDARREESQIEQECRQRCKTCPKPRDKTEKSPSLETEEREEKKEEGIVVPVPLVCLVSSLTCNCMLVVMLLFLRLQTGPSSRRHLVCEGSGAYTMRCGAMQVEARRCDAT